MHIVLFCATNRGLEFLLKLRACCPDDELTVVSFREETWEPPFLDRIRCAATEAGATFIERRNGSSQTSELWTRPVDLAFMVSWRYLIPMHLLDRAKLGAVVVHDSLLPAYRGFSPTVWAMVNGEPECGATMIHATAEVDAGDIIDQVRIAIAPDDVIATVMDRVTAGYLTMLERNIDLLKSGRAPRMRQDPKLATFTCKRTPGDNLIQWHHPLTRVHNLIRAVGRPYTGAFTFHNGAKLTVWKARIDASARTFVGAIPGRVVEIRPGHGVVVLTGDGSLLVETVQPEGGPEVCAADLITSVSTQLG